MDLTTRNILEMSKIKLNKFVPLYSKINLVEEINKVISWVSHDLRARENELELKINDNIFMNDISLDY